VHAVKEVELFALLLLLHCAWPGMVPWQQINASAPFAQAFKDRGAMWMSIVVSFGGLAGVHACMCVASATALLMLMTCRTNVLMG
jgi:amino acid transporter